VREAGSVVALTGAGISVPSGIPDFRTPGSGLWAKVNPMEVAHIDVFHSEPERFWSFYAQRFATLGDRQPNEAHLALVELERRGLLDGVITQNIDMLHRKAGTRELIEVHGSIEFCICLKCETHAGLPETLKLIAGALDGVPRCAECSRPLKPEVVLFGEMLPQRAITRAHELCAGADLLLCIGSSLEVHPVAALPDLTLRGGGEIAIITQGSTPFDHLAAISLGGDVVEELRGLLQEF
jgi:NAD-dependent deacetylase